MIAGFAASNGIPATADEINDLRAPLAAFVATALANFDKIAEPVIEYLKYTPGPQEPTMNGLPDARPNVTLFENDMHASASSFDGFESVRDVIVRSEALSDYFCRDMTWKVPSDGSEQHRAWLSRRLLKVASAVSSEAFARTGLPAFDQGAFDSIFAALTNELSSQYVMRTIVCVLYRTMIERPAVLAQGMMVRPFEVDEANRYLWAIYGSEITPVRSWMDPIPSRMIFSKAALEISIPGPRSSEWLPAETTFPAIEEGMSVLRLAGYNGDVVMSFLFGDSIGYGGGTATIRSEDPPEHDWQQLDAPGIALATQVAEWLRSGVNAKMVRTAVRRLNYGLGRKRDDDSFIDYMVGIESLLTDQTAKGEVSHKVSMRCAALLGETFGERFEIKKDITGLYGVRSAVLHGSDNVSDVRGGSDRLREYLRRLIRAVLARTTRFEAHHADLLMLGETATRTDSPDSEA